MLTIATLLHRGGAYSPAWVRKLQRQVARWAPEHRFVCLTDQPVDGNAFLPPIWCVGFNHAWPKWFCKFEIYRPGLFSGRVLYLDLDTLVLGPLAPLLERPEPVIWHEDGIWKGQLSTALALWTGDDLAYLYHAMRAEPERIMDKGFKGQAPNGVHTDQSAIHVLYRGDKVYDTAVLPGFSVHSRDHLHDDGPPAGASLVHFCGEAKPNACGGWMQRHWEQA